MPRPRQIIIALATEGNTDHRFLASIIQRTFEKVANECKQEIEIFDLICLEPISSDNINIKEKAVQYAIKAVNSGATVLCFHADADKCTDKEAFEYRIKPAFNAIKSDNRDLCKNLVAVVPVQMTEAWMLADKELLKKELGTTQSDSELGINKSPENFADPRKAIKDAIRKARENTTQRRRKQLTIDQLYSPIGQKIDLKKLEPLPSYKKFEKEVEKVFKNLKLKF